MKGRRGFSPLVNWASTWRLAPPETERKRLAPYLAKDFVRKHRLPVLGNRKPLFGFKEGRAVFGEVVPAIAKLIQN